MASRLLLLPGGLNNEHIDRIRDQPLWGSLWPVQNLSQPCYICICESGRGGRRWEGEGLKTRLERLLQPTQAGRASQQASPNPQCGTAPLPIVTSERLLQPTADCRPIINIVDLEYENIAEHLARCDVFYMCGGKPDIFAALFHRHRDTMRCLKEIVSSGKCLYIGSCAGSCMMGKSYARRELPGQ